MGTYYFIEITKTEKLKYNQGAIRIPIKTHIHSGSFSEDEIDNQLEILKEIMDLNKVWIHKKQIEINVI